MARAVARIAVDHLLWSTSRGGRSGSTDGSTFENVPAFFETGPKAITVQISR